MQTFNWLSSFCQQQDLVGGDVGAADIMPALDGYNYHDEPGGQSLERYKTYRCTELTLLQL